MKMGKMVLQNTQKQDGKSRDSKNNASSVDVVETIVVNSNEPMVDENLITSVNAQNHTENDLK